MKEYLVIDYGDRWSFRSYSVYSARRIFGVLVYTKTLFSCDSLDDAWAFVEKCKLLPIVIEKDQTP